MRAVSHDTDLARLDATAQAELVRTGQASPTELVDAAIARLFGASLPTQLSLAPKSVTTPIAMGIAERLGGLPSLTAVLVILTGILGYTTLDEQAASLDQVSGAQTAVVTHLNTTAGLVVGGVGARLVEEEQFGVAHQCAGDGDPSAGADARYPSRYPGPFHPTRLGLCRPP